MFLFRVKPHSVHPHVRGEHAFRVTGSFPCSGSPPRAWGALVVFSSFMFRTRFTPTCVGSIL